MDRTCRGCGEYDCTCDEVTCAWSIYATIAGRLVRRERCPNCLRDHTQSQAATRALVTQLGSIDLCVGIPR